MTDVAEPAAPARIYFAQSRPEVARFLPAACKNVLEIGCGQGRFAKHLSVRQSYWGVEPDPEAARVARTTLNHVIDGTFDSAYSSLPSGFFDLVICNDVIEHMPDHERFFDDIRTRMTRDGVIVGSIPNVRFLPHLIELVLHKDWDYGDAGILDRTHLRFFTARSFLRTVQDHGFAVEAFAGINSITAGPTLLGRLRWRTTLGALQLLTLRCQGDARFMQFGFRLALRNSS